MLTQIKYRFTAVAFMMLSLSACVENPVRQAETVEQKTYAVYGSFMAAEEQGAALILNPVVPVSVKVAIKKVDAAVKPVADSSLAAADLVMAIRREIAMGNNQEDQLVVAIANLSRWYEQLVPAVNRLINLVEENL